MSFIFSEMLIQQKVKQNRCNHKKNKRIFLKKLSRQRAWQWNPPLMANGLKINAIQIKNNISKSTSCYNDLSIIRNALHSKFIKKTINKIAERILSTPQGNFLYEYLITPNGIRQISLFSQETYAGVCCKQFVRSNLPTRPDVLTKTVNLFSKNKF